MQTYSFVFEAVL